VNLLHAQRKNKEVNSRVRARKFLKTWLFRLLCLAPLTLTTNAFASKYNMPIGVTPISRDIYDLHMTIFWICVAIGVAVFSVMFYALISHRKSRHAKPADFHESTKIEILWAIIPFIILVIMAIPATKVLMRMEDESHADINIKITGYQWKWKYDYLDEGIGFFSNLSTPREQIENKAPKNKWYLLEVDHPLVLPIHKKIRFLVTSNDVLHAWWVPELGIKRDAVPGFIHESWARIDKPGIYRGQCAELCGIHHAYMPIVVVAKTEADYKKWINSHRQTNETDETKKVKLPAVYDKTELMARGKKDYGTYCAVCHKPDGKGMPPAFPPLVGGKITTGPVQKHLDVVLNGVKGTVMQAFKEQLSNTQIAAIVTYERNSWGNDNQQKYQARQSS